MKCAEAGAFTRTGQTDRRTDGGTDRRRQKIYISIIICAGAVHIYNIYKEFCIGFLFFIFFCDEPAELD